MARAERLRELERLYVDRAFTDRELAKRFGVERSTIWRDRLLLEGEVPFVAVGGGRWRIDRTKYLSGIRLELGEALALYLAARRASRQAQHADLHMASALEKLAVVLRQPMTERLVVAANRVLQHGSRPERVAVFQTVAHGWTERRKLRLRYRSLRAKESSEFVLSPYLIEPSLHGDGTYAIGRCDEHDGVSTFKLERVEAAELLPDSFDLPDDFDEQDLLKYAWGIWFDDDAPTTIRLRFTPGIAARRVRESRWHHTQRLTDLPDGGCEWEAEVDAWQEMLPWVRGWGADVEVLAPEELRERVAEEARVLVGRYGGYLAGTSEGGEGA